MGKGRRANVNSLTALMDGLNLTDKKQFKQPRTSRSKKSGTKKPDYMRMDEEKAKKVFRRRTLSARNADDKLSEALNKLGLGTKKKRKKRRSKTKRN
jgi:hypothetical protein